MRENYQKTIYACFIGYIVQAIINNFLPLLFLTFVISYDISLTRITLLITINFSVQLLVDLIAISFVDKIGYRASIIIAHVFCAAGLFGLIILPELFVDPYNGLLISIITYAVGGGLIEVLISPIMENCPTKNKEKAMSLLHSFYCWGHVGVVLISTIFFKVFGIENWRVLTIFWVFVPVINIVLFSSTPMMASLEEKSAMPIKALFKNRVFWVLVLMMVCAGASEQSISQWASTFAEGGLGISKALGDLFGPMTFAILMGISRVFYGKFGDKINLDIFMIASSILCILSYLLISLSPNPVFSLIGCGICGLSVGIMWPGSFSEAARAIKNGKTAMFALLALAGDLGCMSGPFVVGFVSSANSDNLKIGILVAIIFPLMLVLGIVTLKKIKN